MSGAVENAAQNFAILRRITLHLLRQDRSSKVGIKIRPMKACSSERYLAQLLGWPEQQPTEPSDSQPPAQIIDLLVLLYAIALCV